MGNIASKYDIKGLSEGLEVDLADLVGLFSSYFEEMKNEVSELKGLLDRKDWYMLERVVHNIKGVSANLYINDVFHETEKFDRLLKNNDTSDADKHVEMIDRMISSAEESIGLFFKENGLEI